MAMPRPGTDFDEAASPAAPEHHPLLAAAAAAGTTLYGFDYAWENLTVSRLIQVLNANSTDFVARYINDPGGKGLTGAETAALEADGIIIAPVYETTGTDFTGGYGAGVQAGSAALADLRARTATPGSTCWFAIDTDTSDYNSTNQYLRGCKSATGSYIAQLYGKFGVVEAAAAAGLGSNHWQTYAWSGGQLSSHAALYQYQNGVMIGGVDMDRDRTLKPMRGPWATFGAVPPPVPPPPPSDWTEQMIMALPTLGPSDTDQALGGALLVHRVQLLVSGIGTWNGLGPVTALTADGIYGPATIAAVKAIQKFFGLSQDGITGQATWHHLITGG
jgi:peptidoglycan hydrolase-like protein with peptidoglycan-binding domain